MLDVGCGSGILSMFCARAGARLVIGVDAASDTLQVAQKIIQKNKFSESQIQLVNCKVSNVTMSLLSFLSQ